MPPKSPKIAVIVQFGLGGTRVAKLSVTQSFRMIDIARDFKIHFTPEIDDMDIVFVNCITSKAIGSYLTVKEAELTNGATITAVIQVPWQVKIQTTTPIQYRCGCWGYGSGYYKACHVWGPNLTINVNTLKPAFNIGRQTSLDDITSCLRHPDWKHNEGLMAHDDVADLVEFCTVENLWSCTVCSKLAYCLKWCRPRDVNGALWRMSVLGSVYCGVCQEVYLPPEENRMQHFRDNTDDQHVIGDLCAVL